MCRKFNLSDFTHAPTDSDKVFPFVHHQQLFHGAVDRTSVEQNWTVSKCVGCGNFVSTWIKPRQARRGARVVGWRPRESVERWVRPTRYRIDARHPAPRDPRGGVRSLH